MGHTPTPIPIALGGSGAVTASANTVFAGPTSGGAAAPAFRAAVADDIPALAASKITTGQLAAARGGSGVDASAAGNGTTLIGNGTGFSLAAPTASNGITVTTGAGTLAFAPSGVNADGLALCYVIKKAFTNLAANTDVAIYSANAPFAFTVLDAFVQTTTGQNSAVMTLRDATGGSGNAVSSAMTAAAAGKTRDASTTAPATIAANGTLVARRTGGNGNITGTVVVYIQRN